MNRPWLRIAMFLWMCLWFGVIVPGHQRGVVTVPGTRLSFTLPSCCAPRNGPAGPESARPGDNRPTSKPAPAEDPARDCYLCHMMARLDVPVPFVLPKIVVTYLGDLPPVPVRSLGGLQFVPDTRGRGPPMSA